MTPKLSLPYKITLILTVIDWPNDPLTFIIPDHTDHVHSHHIVAALSGKDTCGDIQYPIAPKEDFTPFIEMRYYDDTSFVARYYSDERVYTPITGTVQITEVKSI